MSAIRVEPVHNIHVRGLCKKPYPNHPKGCPNYHKKLGCPPQALLLYDVIDPAEPVWAVFNIFDFGAHVVKMKERHPGWSDRQAACCLYWQGTARKQLRLKIEAFLADKPGLVAITCPEACGVDVTATMEKIGEQLEWPPEMKTYQVALIGTPKR